MKRTVYEDGAIITVSNVLSAEDCAAWIEEAERLGFEEAQLGTALGPQRSELRDNDRVMLDDPDRNPLSPAATVLGPALEMALGGEGGQVWIIDREGRWLVEVSADRRLSIERFQL